MKPITLGIIGCGRIAKKHAEAISKLENAKIIACCDIIEERAKKFSEKYNIPQYYVKYSDLLANNKIDVIIIATPNGLHSQIGIDAAKKKKHIVCEKPIATNLKDADNFINECDLNKVNLFVVKQQRLNPIMKLLKNSINKNRFGKIYLVQSNVFWQRPQSYYDSEDWRGTWKLDGGAFTNQAIHYVDALYWLIGPVQSVMGFTKTMARKIEVEDTGVAILNFNNGVLGSINVTMLTYPKNFEGSIIILGDKGTVKIGGKALTKIEKWEFANYDDDDRIIEEIFAQNKPIFFDGHYEYYKNVINTLDGSCKASTDGKSARKSLEIIQAIYKSSKEGKEIILPLQ